MVQNTTLRICKGIPWDNTYQHVRLFDSQTARDTYIQGKTAYTYTNYGYISKSNIIVVEGKADLYRDCNYVAWKNTGYSNRWFFAFITDVVYVSDNTTNIVFEVDLFQTWFYDITIKPCYIDREHTNDDSIGASLTEETVMMGDPVRITTHNFNVGYTWYMYATQKEDHVEETFGSDIYTAPGKAGNELSGYYKIYVGALDREAGFQGKSFVQAVSDFYSGYGKQESLVSLFALFEKDSDANRYEVNRPTTFGNYTPKNNKLFIYPYNYCTVVMCGNEVPFRYEWFEGGKAVFGVKNTKYAGNSTYVYPVGYQKEGIGNSNFDIEDSVPTGALPSASFNTNSFANYLASAVPSVAIGAVGAAIGNYVSAAGEVAAAKKVISFKPKYIPTVGEVFKERELTDALGTVTNSISDFGQHALNSRSVSGTTTLSDLVYEKNLNIRVKEMQVQEEFARIIDDYFSTFGYKTGIVKAPNITGRKSWNYVKTIASFVTGDIPEKAKEFFRNLLDNGVTFWHVDDIGNYSLDNSIEEGVIK